MGSSSIAAIIYFKWLSANKNLVEIKSYPGGDKNHASRHVNFNEGSVFFHTFSCYLTE